MTIIKKINLKLGKNEDNFNVATFIFRPQNIMQTFLKMSSVIYSMAGLGTIEESKVYRERFPSESPSHDSLKEEINEQLPKDVSTLLQ